MKRVFLVHGWDGNPENCWFPWLKRELEEKGYEVHALEMPSPEKPIMEEWIGFLKESVGECDENTYFVGHSVGCQTILRYLLGKSFGKVVLVAPWLHLDEKTIEEEGEEVVEIAKPWLETPIAWGRIKGDFVTIFSDDDPYVPLSDKDIFKEKLNSKVIVEKDKGHFDDEAGVKELPVVLGEF